MHHLLTRRVRHGLGPWGLLIAALAMVSQLALGATPLPTDRPANPVAALDAVSVLCRTGHPPGDKPAPVRPIPRMALCPLSVVLALPVAAPVSPPLLPTPLTSPALRIVPLALARAPPALTVIAAYPRGPPILG